MLFLPDLEFRGALLRLLVPGEEIPFSLPIADLDDMTLAGRPVAFLRLAVHGIRRFRALLVGREGEEGRVRGPAERANLGVAVAAPRAHVLLGVTGFGRCGARRQEQDQRESG